MIYEVVRKTIPVGGNDWNKSPWDVARSVQIKNYMGNKPDHLPKAEVKLSYDDIFIYVFFKVEDKYVRAVVTEDQGNVWEDSCVEFFFTPDDDISKGYFNIEINCGGTMLFHFQKEPGKERIILPLSECNKIAVMHSLPKRNDPEIEDVVVWTVAYRVPIVLLEKYCEVVKPEAQSFWRVNYYKCADNTSHPHWLTWSPVELPSPNFHHSSSFGFLYFK